jgi:hypothetical protein
MNKLFFKIFFIFFIFGQFNKYVNSMKFFFNIPGRTMKCMGEYLTDNTVGNRIKIINLFFSNEKMKNFYLIFFLAIFSINSDTTELRVRLFDPNGVTVYNKVIIL